MRKVVGLLVFLCSFTFAQVDNATGWGDTAMINGFKADSLKYSKWFNLSTYENCRFLCLVDDTASAGFASDSVSFYWGLQFGTNCLNGNNKPDTAIGARLQIDTFTIVGTGSANLAMAIRAIDSTGFFPLALKRVDSTAVTGFMTQDRSVAPEWAPVVRFWAKGLTGNKVGAPLKLRFAKVQRQFSGVRTR